MSAPSPLPVIPNPKALAWGERATRAVLARLTYAQRTTVERTVVLHASAWHAALLVGGCYVLWPELPRARRFAGGRTLDADAVAWSLALRADDRDAPIARCDLLGDALKALVRELLCDRFLPGRHRRAAAAALSARPAGASGGR